MLGALLGKTQVVYALLGFGKEKRPPVGVGHLLGSGQAGGFSPPAAWSPGPSLDQSEVGGDQSEVGGDQSGVGGDQSGVGGASVGPCRPQPQPEPC